MTKDTEELWTRRIALILVVASAFGVVVAAYAGDWPALLAWGIAAAGWWMVWANYGRAPAAAEGFDDTWNPGVSGGGYGSLPSHLAPVSYQLGWWLRDDGDIQTSQGAVIPLEEFAASGGVDGWQLQAAREMKRQYELQRYFDQRR